MANLSKLPLSAFDPRLRALIERGCREYVEVPCESATKAQHLRNTLTTYRVRLKRENTNRPEEWEPLYGTIISTRRDDPHVVTLRPRLAEFEDVLAGLALPVESPKLEHDPLEDLLEEKDDE